MKQSNSKVDECRKLSVIVHQGYLTFMQITKHSTAFAQPYQIIHYSYICLPCFFHSITAILIIVMII